MVIDDILDREWGQVDSLLERKVNYLQKLNGRLLGFLVEHNLMTQEEASDIINAARKDVDDG